MSGLKPVDAATAARMQKDGALLVDVRESGEYAMSHIPGSQLMSLSSFGLRALSLAPGQAVVFFCASGNRTNAYATRLMEKAGEAEAYVIQGGIAAWQRAGLPVESGGNDNAAARGGLFSRMLGL